MSDKENKFGKTFAAALTAIHLLNPIPLPIIENTSDRPEISDPNGETGAVWEKASAENKTVESVKEHNEEVDKEEREKLYTALEASKSLADTEMDETIDREGKASSNQPRIEQIIKEEDEQEEDEQEEDEQEEDEQEEDEQEEDEQEEDEQEEDEQEEEANDKNNEDDSDSNLERPNL